MTDHEERQVRRTGVSLADLGYKLIPVKLGNGSIIELRYMSGVDERFLSTLLRQDLAAREFVVTFLGHQHVNPGLSQAQVEEWTDEDLQRAARAFAEARPSGFGKPISDTSDMYEEFRGAARAYQDELNAAVRKALRLFTASYKDQIQSKFDLSEMWTSTLKAASAFEPAHYGVIYPAEETLHTSIVQSSLDKLGTSRLSDFEMGFDSIAEAMTRSVTNPTLDLVHEYSRSGADAVRAISLDLDRSIAELTQPRDLHQLIHGLPDLTESFRQLVKARDGATALDAEGFSYTLPLWTDQFLAELSDLAAQEGPTGISTELQSITEGEDFENEIQELFAAPSILAKRWPAVSEGVEDHRRGRYFSSVAVLLPQIEGIINDILTLKDVVIKVGNKFYEKNPDGTPGKEIGGLEKKSILAEKEANLNKVLRLFVTDTVTSERNGILHGVNVTYGEAKRSVHLMLVLLSFALVVEELEGDI